MSFVGYNGTIDTFTTAYHRVSQEVRKSHQSNVFHISIVCRHANFGRETRVDSDSKVRRIRSEFENSQNFPFPAYVATTVSNLLRARFRIRTNPLNGVFVFLETREYSISLGIEESLTESKRESPNQIEMTSVVMCDVKRKSKEKLQSFFSFCRLTSRSATTAIFERFRVGEGFIRLCHLAQKTNWFHNKLLLRLQLYSILYCSFTKAVLYSLCILIGDGETRNCCQQRVENWRFRVRW